jgi:hypothetical protein
MMRYIAKLGLTMAFVLTVSSAQAVGKRQLRPMLDPRDRLIDVDRGPGRLSDGERPELLGDFALGSVKCGKEDATATFEIVGNDGAVVELEAQRRLDQLGWHFRQLFGQGTPP